MTTGMFRQLLFSARRLTESCQPVGLIHMIQRPPIQFQLSRTASNNRRPPRNVDLSRVPQLSEDDLEEQFVRGEGPGGQNVNKRSTCVWLRHVPTGVAVRCNQARTQEENRAIARQMLRDRLDDLWNGEDSVAAQVQRLDREKLVKKEQKADRLRAMKKAFRERENLD